MEHHFHDETGNFGITNFWWDHIGRTYYPGASSRKKSPTVFNLGYDDTAADRHPKVRELSGGVISTAEFRARNKGA
jgi:sterol desaturase/sphingolipid hydroxylase (fatty acid hydroxylase superfamily)